MANPMPMDLGERDIIQVVMTGAFYRGHFEKLLTQQDFGLVLMPSEDPEEIPTYCIVLGERRARTLRVMEGRDG